MKKPNIKLVVFDFDGVLVQSAQILEIAKHAGKVDAIKKLIKEGLSDASSAAQLHTEAIRLLAGVPTSTLDEVGRNMKITTGAQKAVGRLHGEGIETAIITNGYLSTCSPVAQELGIQTICANELIIEGEAASGEMFARVIDGPAKAIALEKLLRDRSIKAEECAAIGNDVNDLPMLETVGLAIGFAATPEISNFVDIILDGEDLDLVATAVLAYGR